MKVQPLKTIKSLYYANKPLKYVTLKDNIVIKNELDGYYSQIINDQYGKINKYAKKAGANLTLAQKGELLLINSGAHTSFINQKEIKGADDVYQKIVDNINENYFKKLALKR